jgi:5-methylthioadenosine/S-adenosylhomocysteine deaminase
VDINPSAQTLISLYPGASVVDARERIVLPGFVNAHYHGESVLLRHITRRASYGSWNALPGLRGAFAHLLDPASASGIATLYRTAGFLHLKSGTTAVAEYPAGYTPAVLQGAIENIASAGVRSVFALQTWEQIESFRSSPPALRQFSISLGPEEGYTVYRLDNFVRASTETQFPLAAHLGEARTEVEALRGRFKKSPLRVLKDSGALVPATHIIHCNHIPEKDLDLLRDGGNPVTLCIRSALAKQTGYPLLRSLASHDVTICLGTDWGETDLLGEIRVLRNLRMYFPRIPPYTPLELIRMATINGAHALGIASQTGSLEVGKHADLVMIPFNDVRVPSLSVHPTAEEIAGIITDYCDTGMIADVMAQGVFRVRNGEAARVDGNEILRDFRQLQRAFLPPGAENHEPDHTPGVPLIPSDRSEKASLHGQEETMVDVPREKKANMRPPGPAPDESLQKFPIVTKKIRKVFGEDDT